MIDIFGFITLQTWFPYTIAWWPLFEFPTFRFHLDFSFCFSYFSVCVVPSGSCLLTRSVSAACHHAVFKPYRILGLTWKWIILHGFGQGLNQASAIVLHMTCLLFFTYTKILLTYQSILIVTESLIWFNFFISSKGTHLLLFISKFPFQLFCQVFVSYLILRGLIYMVLLLDL